MHALGRFITELMDARSMSRPDLERASGLSRQHLHQLLDDRRINLGRMVDEATLAGLVRAFPDLGEAAFIVKAAEALGVPVDRLNTVDVDPDRLSDDALLGILARRLKQAGRPSSPGSTDTGAPAALHEVADEPEQLAARHGSRARSRLDNEWDEPEQDGESAH